MDILLALTLSLTAAEPTLAGAPPPPPGTQLVYGDGRAAPHPFPPPPAIRQGRAHVVTSSGYRSGETASSRRAAGSVETVVTRDGYQVDHAVTSSRTSHQVSGHAGSGRRTVTLGADFFVGGLTGGVEGPTAPVYYGYAHYGRGVVVIRGSHAPRSAGQAAARLGLPRG